MKIGLQLHSTIIYQCIRKSFFNFKKYPIDSLMLPCQVLWVQIPSLNNFASSKMIQYLSSQTIYCCIDVIEWFIRHSFGLFLLRYHIRIFFFLTNQQKTAFNSCELHKLVGYVCVRSFTQFCYCQRG